MITEDNTKFCPDCELILDVSNFSLYKSRKDGLTTYCKACLKIRKDTYRLNNSEKVKEQSRLQYKLRVNKDPLYLRKCCAAVKKYRVEHLEKVRYQDKIRSRKYPNRFKDYYRKNKESLSKKDSEYRKNNPHKIREFKKIWKSNNPESVKTSHAKRRSIKLSCCPQWSQSGIYKNMILSIYKQSSDLSKTTGIQHHVDHIIPLQPPKVVMFEGEMIALVCGLHVPANLQILTATENMIKHNKFEPYIESEMK